MNLNDNFNESSEEDTPHLKIRFSEPADEQKILNFYKENTHQHVDQRKDELWTERAREGRVIMVEDHEGNLGFSSVAYDFEQNGIIKWMELGSTMNQQNPEKKPYDLIKGVSLYPSIIASQALHEFLARTPEDMIVACIFEDNEAVINMLNTRVGWNIIEPQDDILKATKDTKGDANPHEEEVGDVWLAATTDTLPHQARLVLDFIEKGETTGLFNKKSRTHINLDTSSFSLANEFRAAVEALAYGPLAEELENNPHIGMKAARELLEKHLQGPLQSPPAPGSQP